MANTLERYGISDRDLARGRNLKLAGISAPAVLTLLPVAIFILLTIVLSGAPIFAISSFVLGIFATIAGLLIGLGFSAYFFVKHQRWTTEMRERIAANGIGADEIDWFRKEMRPAEKRALKSMDVADPLLADAYRETLASRLTATRIVRSSKKELQVAKRREIKLKSLKAGNTKRFLEQLKEDTAKIEAIHVESKQMLAEAESRLEMIEASAARGGTFADSEVALKKLAARASQLPLALEAARIHEEAVAELEKDDNGLFEITGKEPIQ